MLFPLCTIMSEKQRRNSDSEGNPNQRRRPAREIEDEQRRKATERGTGHIDAVDPADTVRASGEEQTNQDAREKKGNRETDHQDEPTEHCPDGRFRERVDQRLDSGGGDQTDGESETEEDNVPREQPLVHDGEHYQIPYTGEGATGLGKPLKSILHGDPSLKIYTGAFTPAGVRTAAEIADGFFPVWMNPERFDIFEDALADGFAKAGGGKGLDGFDIMPFVTVCLGDDLEACRLTVKKNLALYVGGMGARGKNFYNDYSRRLGHEAAAAKIQDLFLDGKHKEAAMAVPDEYVDQIALVGPKERIIERLGVWREASAKGHVSAILLSGASLDTIRLIAEEVL